VQLLFLRRARTARSHPENGADETKGGAMNDDKLPATGPAPEARDPARRGAKQGEFEQAGQSATTRTVGVYDRPAQRAGLSLPLLVIMILAALVSVVVTVRFLF
jgi:hypothetical protein